MRVKLVMTLLARDEVDIVDAQIAFHLNAGVDFVIATDNRSEDGTTEILKSYARDRVLHLIEEHGDDMREEEWVTRMARMAATEFGADWIVNTDADEFWWPRIGTLREILASVPKRFGIVPCLWRNFVPRPDDGAFFAERMTVRLSLASPLNGPASPFHLNQKVAHRADPHVTVGRGNHGLVGGSLIPLRGWYPIEVLHFPLRTAAQCEQKFLTHWIATSRNPRKDPTPHVTAAYEAHREGRLREYYDSFTVDDEELARGLEQGTLCVDTRVRDALGALGFADRAPVSSSSVLSRPGLQLDAAFVLDASLLAELDDVVTTQRRLDDLERRVAALEPSWRSRLGRTWRASRASPPGRG